MTIEELFGTLQQSTVASWRKHLRTAKYAKHMALDEFYKEMPEKVDALIEGWMGAHGKKVKGFDNILQSSNMNTLKYLSELKRVCKEGYGLLGDNDELKSLMDDIVNLINSTLYKVKELSENNTISLVNYINESLVNEGIDNKFIKLLSNMYNDYGDLSPVSDCFHWLDELNWEVMKEIKYAEAVNDINDSVDIEYALDYYAPVMLAMAKAGKKDTIKAISKITDKYEMEDFDINESLVNENYEPTSKPKDWEKVLKKLNSAARYSNYSQLCDIENILKYNGDAVEWLESIESGYKIKLDKNDRIALQDIVSFYQENYEYWGMHYMDQEEEIEEFKENTPLNDNKAVNYGVECEDYYESFTYIGDNSGKKYAQLIAKYGDCSEDHSGF